MSRPNWSRLSGAIGGEAEGNLVEGGTKLELLQVLSLLFGRAEVIALSARPKDSAGRSLEAVLARSWRREKRLSWWMRRKWN